MNAGKQAQRVKSLLDAFRARTARVGVVGLGYVGLPLVRELHAAGFRVVGFDVDESKIRKLRNGERYLAHLEEDLVRTLSVSERFLPTSKPDDLGACDAVCLCVPTPLGKHQEPDLSFVENSTRMVARAVADAKKAGKRERPVLISLESTTYPGTTRGDCQPILESQGLELGEDFLLCFSPEREDPGRTDIHTKRIPRLVGGVDEASGEAGHALYSQALESVHMVRSAEVAESAKLLENIFRCVNIAMVNELKPVLAAMGIDIWEVIEAASTKPFGFMRFEPGPGLGGHCIPIDPYYLSWKAREFGHVTRFIELAGEVNNSMPAYVVSTVQGALNDVGKSLKGSSVLVLGVAYKPDVDDVRETPATHVIELLEKQGAKVGYHDPHVPVFPSMRKHQINLQSTPLTPANLKAADAVVVVTHHKAIDWEQVGEHARLVVDARNAMRNVRLPKARIVKA
jgi:UDP-N-acetyl-D-glucosamine dehydrogenase